MINSLIAFSHTLKALGQDLADRDHEPETPWMRFAIEGSPVVLHVGASTGRHAFALLKALPGARIHAVEPASFHITVLKQGIAMRGLQNRIEVIHAAASDQPGEMTLVTPRKTTGKRARSFAFISDSSVARPDFQGDGFFKETVKVIRLDDLGLPKVDFIRMDIEGAEHAALKGAMGIIDRDLPNALIEIHPHILRENFGTSPEAVEQIFRSRGYRVFAIGEAGVEERASFDTDRRFQDFFLLHPSKPLPDGAFKDLMAAPPKV